MLLINRIQEINIQIVESTEVKGLTVTFIIN